MKLRRTDVEMEIDVSKTFSRCIHQQVAQGEDHLILRGNRVVNSIWEYLPPMMGL